VVMPPGYGDMGVAPKHASNPDSAGIEAETYQGVAGKRICREGGGDAGRSCVEYVGLLV
jgi:hypothetical protein